MFQNHFYYLFKPFIPRRLQIMLRKQMVRRKRKRFTDVWPIDPSAARKPLGWPGWPYQRKFALVLTHDVESRRGLERCMSLAEIESELGFCSSFNFVPGDYDVPLELRDYLENEGLEIGVHGLHHEGNLFSSRKAFLKKADRINHFLQEWESVGFRTPSMYHNLEWIHHLNIEYDSSTFDTDPFEPQSDGVGTIFPFWVQGFSGEKGYAELPYTLPQDFLLFILMEEKSIDIWKQKLDWITDKGGMALVNVHPDYMNFDGKRLGIEEYPAEYYSEFLKYINSKYDGQYWHVLPKALARFWVANMVKGR